MPSPQEGYCGSFVLSHLNKREVCLPEFASLYCSGLATKDICARSEGSCDAAAIFFTFCRLLQGSRHCGNSHMLLPIHWLVLLLALTSFTSHHSSKFSFSLSWANYAGSIPTRPEGQPPPLKEVGDRQVLVCLCGLQLSSQVLVCSYKSQFVHDFAYIHISFTNVTLTDIQ